MACQVLKQGANSAVRFTTYSSLKQLVQGSAPAGQPLPGGVTFGLGALAGIVTVCQSPFPPAPYISFFLPARKGSLTT